MRRVDVVSKCGAKVIRKNLPLQGVSKQPFVCGRQIVEIGFLRKDYIPDYPRTG